MREKVFSSGLSAPPPTPNVTNNIKKTGFDLPEIKINKPDLNSKLGEKTTDLGNDKTGLDDMKKFNDIPINPDIKIEEPKLSPEQILKEKLIFLRKLEAMEKQGVKLSK